ncbi:GGDEF domain-containing protein [Alteromonas oceani]|uniref:diguanylate cyclase n=1 Tax=Alteromonas oceani TaxID=2071609 RepID=A0ABV7JS93_9ALTE|nr:GGDEF domain-containing protein [Alteromonas oceani]
MSAFEELYRPINNGSATHPLTALTISAIGVALYCNIKRQPHIALQRFFSIIAITFTVARILEVLLSSELTHYFVPFQEVVSEEVLAGKHNSMGINTAIMLCGLGISILLSSFKRSISSQFVASIAGSIPLVSFLGYAYGIDGFYGEMSMLTAVAGFALSLATIFLSANKGVMRALLSPHIGGRVARYQALAGYLVPCLFGLLVIKSIVSNETSFFGIFVIGVCWFILIMAGVSAFFTELVDGQRRETLKELTRMATTDELTGLPNRRTFIERVELELSRAERVSLNLWMLMIDVDNFKEINDTEGHAMGDNVLKAIAGILKSSVRQIDAVGRLGGEEFAILLPDTPLEGARRVAESIRSNIESEVIKGWTDSYGPVTISIGVAKAGINDSFQALLDKADEALYDSKHSGRNKVSFDPKSLEINS